MIRYLVRGLARRAVTRDVDRGVLDRLVGAATLALLVLVIVVVVALLFS